MKVANGQELPVNIVGSSIFGRYGKISLEKTYNMYISDEWMVSYAGFKKVAQVFTSGEGRALFHSVRGNFMIGVASAGVFKITKNLIPQFIGNLDTVSGQVVIDENLTQQICLVDGEAAWIYNYESNILTKQTLIFIGNKILPGYVCFHNTFFLIASAPRSINSQNWYAFEFDTPNTIKLNTQFSLQTKPDSATVVKRLPGKGNNVLVAGTTVAEIWTQVGGLENYRRIQSYNLDSGFVSNSTIDANEDFICGLSKNEKNAPVILVCDGSSSKKISTDGINFLLQTIKFPEDSTGFLYSQDGHLFYQLTFFNKADNLSLIYDFTTDKFFHISNEKGDYHPARQIVFFNNKTYFISLTNPAIYEMSTEFTTYDYSVQKNTLGEEIPRIRICKALRKKDSLPFRAGRLQFWIEQGTDNTYLMKLTSPICDGQIFTEDGEQIITESGGFFLITEDAKCLPFQLQIKPRVDMSISKNGNKSFSNIVSRELNQKGHYRNILSWNRLGFANEFTPQFRFWGFQRFTVQNGTLEVY